MGIGAAHGDVDDDNHRRDADTYLIGDVGDHVVDYDANAHQLRSDIQDLQEADQPQEHPQTFATITVGHPIRHACRVDVLVDPAISSGDKAQAQAGGSPLGCPEPDVCNAVGKALSGNAKEISGAGKRSRVGDSGCQGADVAGPGGVGFNRRHPLRRFPSKRDHSSNVQRCQYDEINHVLPPLYITNFLLDSLEREVDRNAQQDRHTGFKHKEPM